MSDSATGQEPVGAGRDVLAEASKADQERQKTAQKALDLVEQAGGFLGQIFNPAAKEFGDLLGDQMKYWRFRNFVRVLGKAQRIVDGSGLQAEQLKVLPFGEAIRAIEAASQEEEDSVQELWARLIANSVDPARKVSIKKVYVSILQGLSPAEAAFIELLWVCERRNRVHSSHELAVSVREMDTLAEEKWRVLEREERNVAIQNLVRMRCVTFRSRPIDMNYLFAKLPGGRTAGGPSDRWAATDPEKFQRVIQELGEMIFVSAGVKDYSSRETKTLSGRVVRTAHTPAIPELNFMLTPLGKALMRACERT